MENRFPGEDPNKENKLPGDEESKEESTFLGDLLERLSSPKKEEEGRTETFGKKKKKRRLKGFDFLLPSIEKEEVPEQKAEQPAAEPDTATTVENALEPQQQSTAEFEAPMTEETVPEMNQPEDFEPKRRLKSEIRPISGAAADSSEAEANLPEDDANQGRELETFSDFDAGTIRLAVESQEPARPQLTPELTHEVTKVAREKGRVSSVLPAFLVDIMARGRDRKERRKREKGDQMLASGLKELRQEMLGRNFKQEEQAEGLAKVDQPVERQENKPAGPEAALEKPKISEPQKEWFPESIRKATPEKVMEEVQMAAEKGVPIEKIFEQSHEVKDRRSSFGHEPDNSYHYTFNTEKNAGSQQFQQMQSQKAEVEKNPQDTYKKAVMSGTIAGAVIFALLLLYLFFR